MCVVCVGVYVCVCGGGHWQTFSLRETEIHLKAYLVCIPELRSQSHVCCHRFVSRLCVVMMTCLTITALLFGLRFSSFRFSLMWPCGDSQCEQSHFYHFMNILLDSCVLRTLVFWLNDCQQQIVV